MPPRLLISAPACSFSLGSESNVGAHIAECLAIAFNTDIVTLRGGGIEGSHSNIQLPCDFADPNDVSWKDLLRFECLQNKLFTNQFLNRYELFHRVTPSGWKRSLFRPPDSMKVIVGPVLLSIPPPAAFFPTYFPLSFSRWTDRLTFNRFVNSFARRYLEKHDTDLLSRADLIFAGTEVSFRKLNATQQQKAVIVPYAGVDDQLFTPIGRSSGNKKPFNILYVGRLESYKGLEFVIRAVGRLRSDISAKLRVVGTGNKRASERFQTIAATAKLGDRIEFLGHQHRVTLPQYYREADVLVMPSIETYGLAVVEAMACGCVPIVADINGPGEIVAAQWGVKLPLTVPESLILNLATCIEELHDDYPRWQRLSEAARHRASTFHDWASIRRVILAAYERFV